LIFRVQITAEISDKNKRNGRSFDDVLLEHKEDCK